MTLDIHALTAQIMTISQEAGEAILSIYQRHGEIPFEKKEDASPVTEADLAAHDLINASLTRLTPGIPVLSEESAPISPEVRRGWQRYWLVDPLDGTREFIKRSDEFTVNIALIERGRPILGIVHVPVSGSTYAGSRVTGAIKRTASGKEHRIHAHPLNPYKSLTLVASRSRTSVQFDGFLKRVKQIAPLVVTRVGSSLKACLIAEGLADIYPRFGPTCEWDTAAVQAILEAAGGALVDAEMRPLRYNSKDDLINPDFFAIGDAAFDWKPILRG
jgi:3'(2'), 5'-bisphosphate nucleotidase